uniref:LysM domain-containing protein n=1 Tax=Hanusia phi TaxID=3032 RepID=A0A7S0HWI6_9CRYP
MDYMGNPLADSSDQGGCNVTGTRCLGLRTNRPSYLLLTHMFILICAFTSVTASELQYATIRYSQEMGNVVKFVIPMQWRRTVEFTTIQKGEVVDVVGTAGVGSGPVVFNPGYGPTHRIQMFVLDVGMDYVFGEAYFTLASYPSLNNNGAPWVATLQGCCLPCSYSHFNLTANVDLLNAPSSSAFKSLPTVYVQGGVTSIINLPANTPGGVNSPFWRLGQGLEVSQLFIDRNVFFFDGPDYLQGRLTANFSVSNPALQGSCQDSFSVIAQTLSVPGFMVPLLFIVKTVPQADWIKRPTILSPTVSSLNGYVGYDVFFTISATSSNPGIMQQVRVFQLPEGGQTLNSRTAVQSASVDVHWMPSEKQTGIHWICYEAVDGLGLHSEQKCISVVVVQQQAVLSFANLIANQSVSFYMREHKTVSIIGQSSIPYDLLDIAVEGTIEYGQVVTVNTPSVQTKVKATDNVNVAQLTADLSWRPDINMGGYNKTICFRLSARGDLSRPAVPSVSLCIRVVVPKCKYMAQSGDTLQKIGQIFNADWLTIWGLNAQLDNSTVSVGQEVNIGRSYKVVLGDTLLSIANLFSVTVASLRQLNFDVSQAKSAYTLEPDTLICLFPNTCP